jgi:hypothetical protein
MKMSNETNDRPSQLSGFDSQRNPRFEEEAEEATWTSYNGYFGSLSLSSISSPAAHAQHNAAHTHTHTHTCSAGVCHLHTIELGSVYSHGVERAERRVELGLSSSRNSDATRRGRSLRNKVR